MPAGYISAMVSGWLFASWTPSFQTRMLSFSVMSEPHFTLFEGGFVAGVEHQGTGQGQRAVVAAPHGLAAADGVHEVLPPSLVRPARLRHHHVVGVLAVLFLEDPDVRDGDVGGPDGAEFRSAVGAVDGEVHQVLLVPVGCPARFEDQRAAALETDE